MEILNQKIEELSVHVFHNREEMGTAAAHLAAEKINGIIKKNGMANIIFAAAPSQNEVLSGLLKEDIDWTKVRAFHQDEYVGIEESEPAGFGNFLRRAIYDHVPLKESYYLLCREEEVPDKCREYEKLLKTYSPDLIFLGIGENGHLAFNDPAAADFDDPETIKVVELEDVCRQQQVNDGCFACFEDVPRKAVTMTMSFIQSVPQVICCVPAGRKANAVKNALYGPVSVACPASILRRHPAAELYLDADSASLILERQ
ncbi:MAG: glucosamine-6-phosphate deaminase [Lachnospiraceae bacterium]|nr:glucosamine-6-phosphate deaminase [Lachnospiraceae bacterium]